MFWWLVPPANDMANGIGGCFHHCGTFGGMAVSQRRTVDTQPHAGFVAAASPAFAGGGGKPRRLRRCCTQIAINVLESLYRWLQSRCLCARMLGDLVGGSHEIYYSTNFAPGYYGVQILQRIFPIANV